MFGIDDIISEGLKIVNKFVPDTAQAEAAAAEFKLKMLDVQAQVDAKQAETNTAEASSQSLFIAGWRPFVGWVCASAFVWQFIAQPLLMFVLAQMHLLTAVPQLDTNQLVTVLFGMLGIGGMRTFEKVNGVGK